MGGLPEDQCKYNVLYRHINNLITEVHGNYPPQSKCAMVDQYDHLLQHLLEEVKGKSAHRIL